MFKNYEFLFKFIHKFTDELSLKSFNSEEIKTTQNYKYTIFFSNENSMYRMHNNIHFTNYAGNS